MQKEAQNERLLQVTTSPDNAFVKTPNPPPLHYGEVKTQMASVGNFRSIFAVRMALLFCIMRSKFELQTRHAISALAAQTRAVLSSTGAFGKAVIVAILPRSPHGCCANLDTHPTRPTAIDGIPSNGYRQWRIPSKRYRPPCHFTDLTNRHRGLKKICQRVQHLYSNVLSSSSAFLCLLLFIHEIVVTDSSAVLAGAVSHRRCFARLGSRMHGLLKTLQPVMAVYTHIAGLQKDTRFALTRWEYLKR